MRELRVEDALLYLDQVKVEFGDRPHIYNEFLDIMKTFKTQRIDTPGVIRRVSSLFQGNKKLVLGFNTFLPEGYKIELPLDGDGPPVAVYRAPGQSGVTQILGPAAGAQAPILPPPAPVVSQGQPQSVMGQPQQPPNASQPPAQQGGGPPSSRPTHPPQIMHPSSEQPHLGAARVSAPPPHGQAALSALGQPPHSQHRNALVGGQQPQQGAPIGGPQGPHAGGSEQPLATPSSNAGGPYQQHMPHAPSQHQAMQMQHQSHQQHSQSSQQMMSHSEASNEGRGNGERPQPSAAVAGAATHHHPMGQPLSQQHHPLPVGPNGTVGSAPIRLVQPPPQVSVGPGGPHTGIMQQPQPPPTGALQQPPVEFDHAINYVTTIKKRFSTEPDTYKKFLEILHTYQKEQRGIKEVLDEVSLLFSEHPDLLKEFTYFLPDAVQAQAKAQLDQVAKESEARKRAVTSKQAIMQTARGMQRHHGIAPGSRVHPPAMPPGPSGAPPNVFTPAPAPVPFGATQGRSEEREREICRSAVYGVVSFSPKRPQRRNDLSPPQAALKNGRPQMIPIQPLQPSTAEAAFFDRAKLHLNRKELAPDKPPGSRRHTPYTEFLKCLHLYGSDILNKEELFLLLRGLFMQGHAPKSGANAGGGASNPTVASDAQELLREFEEIIVGRGPYADQETMLKDKSKYGSLSSREFDVSNSERATPSYRTYANDYPHNLFFSHSGQTDADASVLSSKVLCVPSIRQKGNNSPEDYDGVRERRNAYEETMIIIEDERFEVDMAIERNVMAMRQVEPIADEVTELRENEEKDGQPIGRMHYKLRSRTLNCAQLNAIARLYGDSGDEVVQHMMRNPVAVLPMVYRRLREKDAEWRKAKTELSKRWKTLSEANHEGSLDVLCYFNKKEIEQLFSTEQLLEECKEANRFANDSKRLMEQPTSRPFVPQFFLSEPDEEHLLFHPHLRLALNNDMPHKDAFDCIACQINNGPSTSGVDRERVARIWAEFVVPFFNYPTHWVLGELRKGVKSDKSSPIVKFSPGQGVKTAFGNGKILSLVEGNPATAFRYKIRLGFGIAYVRPNAIVHALPSTDKTGFARTGDKMEPVEVPGESDAKKLAKRCELLFATGSIYIFMRLYCLLVSIFSDGRDFLLEGQKVKEVTPSTDMEVDGVNDAITAKAYDYPGIISSLQELIGRDIDGKSFESYCRKAGREKAHQLAAVPKLVKACADALLKVARENKVLSLYDISQLKEMDPINLREQSLKIAEHASYRIQYDPESQSIYFAYLPSESDLSLVPRDDSTDNMVTSEGDGAIEDNDADALDDSQGEGTEDAMEDDKIQDSVDFPQQAKRPKLK